MVHPSEAFSVGQISEVILIGISLSFEGYVVICLEQTAILDKANKILQYIAYKEEETQHLDLLPGMYVFMVAHFGTQHARCVLFAHKEKGEYCQGDKALEGKVFANDGLHLSGRSYYEIKPVRGVGFLEGNAPTKVSIFL